MPPLKDERHTQRRILLPQSLGKHLHHILHQPLLHLQAGRTIIHHPSDLRQTEYPPLWIRQIGKPVLPEKRPAMMLAQRIERPAVHYHIIVHYAVLAVGKGRDARRLRRVVAAENLRKHPQNAVRSLLQPLPRRIFAYVFKQIYDVLSGLLFCNHTRSSFASKQSTNNLNIVQSANLHFSRNYSNQARKSSTLERDTNSSSGVRTLNSSFSLPFR